MKPNALVNKGFKSAPIVKSVDRLEDSQKRDFGKSATPGSPGLAAGQTKVDSLLNGEKTR